MIKTQTPVVYDFLDPSKKAIMYAEVISWTPHVKSKTISFNVREWIEETYAENVPVYDVNGNQTGMEEQTFTKMISVPRNPPTPKTFAEINAMIDYINENYDLSALSGFELQVKQAQIGHLLMNNSESIRGAQWEEVN